MKWTYPLTMTAILFSGTLTTRAADDDQAASITLPPAPVAVEVDAADGAKTNASVEVEASVEETAPTTTDPANLDTRVQVKSKDGETTIVVRSFGKVIHVGPGGKVDVSDLPAAEAGDDADTDSDSRRRGRRHRVLNLSKIMQLGDDGVLKELDALPETISKMIGKSITSDAGVEGEIQVIGPDGKEFNFDFEELAPAGQELARSIEQAVLQSGIDIPADVALELMKAKQRIESQMRSIRSRAEEQIQVPAVAKAMAEDQKQMHEKLDRILNRLDKLETEVAQMRKQAEL